MASVTVASVRLNSANILPATPRDPTRAIGPRLTSGERHKYLPNSYDFAH